MKWHILYSNIDLCINGTHFTLTLADDCIKLHIADVMCERMVKLGLNFLKFLFFLLIHFWVLMFSAFRCLYRLMAKEHPSYLDLCVFFLVSVIIWFVHFHNNKKWNFCKLRILLDKLILLFTQFQYTFTITTLYIFQYIWTIVICFFIRQNLKFLLSFWIFFLLLFLFSMSVR